MDLDALTQAICQVAYEAGAEIMQVYQSADFAVDSAVESKEDRSPLTAADLASHRHIVQALHELTPQYPVLSEESVELPFAERSQWETYLLVDPLDGTREFLKRNGEFSVLIALIHQHEPVLGVVYAPVLDTFWYASLGNGAWKQEGDELPLPIMTRAVGEVPVIVGSRSHAGSSLQAFLDQLGEYELVSMGSILKACLVADGRADLYPRLGLTSEWDTAAAQIIVEEAGGSLQQVDGSALRYNTKPSLLNPHFLVAGDTAKNWAAYFVAEQSV